MGIIYRQLCGKLSMKAESQQIDRILEEFSKRYWECNPHAVFGNTGKREHCDECRLMRFSLSFFSSKMSSMPLSILWCSSTLIFTSPKVNERKCQDRLLFETQWTPSDLNWIAPEPMVLLATWNATAILALCLWLISSTQAVSHFNHSSTRI